MNGSPTKNPAEAARVRGARGAARLKRGLIRAPYALRHDLLRDLPQVREQRPVSVVPAARRRPATPAALFRHALPRLWPPSLSHQRHRSGRGCRCPAFGHGNRRGRSRLDASRAAARPTHCASAGSKRQRLTTAPPWRGLRFLRRRQRPGGSRCASTSRSLDDLAGDHRIGRLARACGGAGAGNLGVADFPRKRTSARATGAARHSRVESSRKRRRTIDPPLQFALLLPDGCSD